MAWTSSQMIVMIHCRTAFLSWGLLIDFPMDWAQQTTLPHKMGYLVSKYTSHQVKKKTKHFNDVKSQNAFKSAHKMQYDWVRTGFLQHLKLRNKGEGSRCRRFDKREHALISCAGCDPALPCTVPQGYCRALTILFPIFTSSVLPTTANGKWL